MGSKQHSAIFLFIREHRYFLGAVYAVIYLRWFGLLEKTITADSRVCIMPCSADDLPSDLHPVPQRDRPADPGSPRNRNLFPAPQPDSVRGYDDQRFPKHPRLQFPDRE